MGFIDLRSDTVSMPTSDMMKAIFEAELGDSVLGEDPTVKELEEYGSELFDKEGALFLVSGTMANQTAVATFTKRGQEIIVGSESHIYNLEVAGLAAISQVQARPILWPKGVIDPSEIEDAIRGPGIQEAETGLLCLENTYDLNRGYVLSVDDIRKTARVCQAKDIPIYMDGARIFNAAVATGIDVCEITAHVDAIQVCLTKGLGAPVGSLLLGDGDFIAEARRMQQRLGGGMRQAGIIAAPCIIALKKMVGRLAEDHENAQYLAQSLLEIDERLLRLEDVQTNIVYLNLEPIKMDSIEFVSALKEQGILVKPIGRTGCRMVCYHNIDRRKIKKVVDMIYGLLKE